MEDQSCAVSPEGDKIIIALHGKGSSPQEVVLSFDDAFIILGERDLLHQDVARRVADDARHGCGLGEALLLHQQFERAITAAARRHLEHAGLLALGVEHRADVQGLNEAAPGDRDRQVVDRDTGLDLLADHGGVRGDHLVNRMIFSQQITALEAYLGDTLLNEVMGDKVAMQRLIDKDADLAKEKFTLSEVSKDPGLVERKVRTHLREVMYHNLKKVDVLYNIALGVRILDLAADKASLFKAVLLRHDCVHRNGFDKEGNEIDVFTKAFVQDTADLIKAFVEGIQKAVRLRLV